MNDFFDENKTPKDKFFEIVFNANKNLVIEELEEVFKRLAALEILSEECFAEEAEQKINEIVFNKSDELEEMENDLYIDTMSKILTKNE
jgi:hypothetical protein